MSGVLNCIGGYLLGSCVSIVPWGQLVKLDRLGSGELLIALDHALNLVVNFWGGARDRRLPLWRHATLAAAGSANAALANAALVAALPVGVVVTLKNGSLVASLLLGWLLGRTYNRRQILSVLGVTLGCTVTALSGARARTDECGSGVEPRYAFGLACMLGSLACRAGVGFLQEAAFRAHPGATGAEICFYRALISLPAVGLATGSRVLATAARWRASDDAAYRVFLCVFNVGGNVAMARAAIALIDRTNSVSAAVVMAVARFASLAATTVLLGEQDAGLFLGSALVLAGVVGYAKATDKVKRS